MIKPSDSVLLKSFILILIYDKQLDTKTCTLGVNCNSRDLNRKFSYILIFWRYKILSLILLSLKKFEFKIMFYLLKKNSNEKLNRNIGLELFSNHCNKSNNTKKVRSLIALTFMGCLCLIHIWMYTS